LCFSESVATCTLRFNLDSGTSQPPVPVVANTNRHIGPNDEYFSISVQASSYMYFLECPGLGLFRRRGELFLCPQAYRKIHLRMHSCVRHPFRSTVIQYTRLLDYCTVSSHSTTGFLVLWGNFASDRYYLGEQVLSV